MHAVYSPRSKIDIAGCEVCHPQRGVPKSTGQRVYTAKEQEKRLKIDFTRLKDDAASVTNPFSLVLQANAVIRHYVFIVMWLLQC